jgi:PAS domain S-box-containing protein
MPARRDIPHRCGNLFAFPSAVSTDGIWIIDVEGKTLFANDRMGEILGVSSRQMTGQDSFAYVFPEDLEAAQRLFEAKKAGDSSCFRFRLRRRDGTSVAVSIQGTPMYSPEGEFKGIVGTFCTH